MDKDHLRQEAERLSNDAVLSKALDDMRFEAVESLIKASVDNPTQILWLQAKCAVIDEFREQLQSFIDDGQPAPERPGFA